MMPKNDSARRHQHPRYRRPAAWDQRNAGLPVALTAAAGRIALPPGLWHVSDYAAPHIADPAVQVVAATHASGAPFTLLVAPAGRILAVSAGTKTGLRKIGMSDPTAWARRQTWDLKPLAEGVTA